MSSLPETPSRSLTGPRRTRAEGPADLALLPDLVRAVLARDTAGAAGDRDRGGAAAGWAVEPGAFWCHVRPGDAVRRTQGWKLHVSATPLSAPLVLARAAEVLTAHRAPFKFAASPARVAALVSGRFARGGAGKFITVYPVDDAQFRLLAEELHRATVGLPGPAVLSDRRYLPDSQVYYRYGVFAAAPELTADGAFAARLTDPEGRPVSDERNAWYSPPSWAGEPFPGRPVAPARSTATAKPVLLNGRYLVRGAIQHSNKGGVFRAEDTATGDRVVVKQARPHVGAGLEGLDVRDLLRREAALLDHFGRRFPDRVPRLVEVFEQQGSAFLVAESVPGATLRRTVAERLVREGSACPDGPTAGPLVRQLLELVATAHELGVTLHDFNPNNVMVTPDGQLRLIDLEMAAAQGERWVLGATRGYTAPELRAADPVAPAFGPAVDLYALGATILHALTGADPLFAADRPAAGARPDEERLSRLLDLLARDQPLVRRYGPLVRGLMRDAPEDRWTLERAREALDGGPAPTTAPGGPAGSTGSTGSTRSAGSTGSAGSTDAARVRARLLHDGIAHLLATMRPADPDRLWAADSFGETCDPVALQHGSAGGVGVLARALRHADDLAAGSPYATAPGTRDGTRDGSQDGSGDGSARDSAYGPPVTREALRAGLRTAALWTADRQEALPGNLPGLHFGRSGTAWALLDAARALGDAALTERALALALALPLEWPNPDVCHGAAGAGLTQLHFWRTTGDRRFLDRAVQAAEGLLAAARSTPEGVFWPVPEDFDSGLAGAWHYGFAHGVAGVGTFLLLAWEATGDERLRAAAVAAGSTLAAAARRGPAGTLWPVDRARHLSGSPDLARHWCSGSSGVGTFLVRLRSAAGPGGEGLADLVEGAAAAVRAGRVTDTAATCHGLAGNAEFLLDAAELTGDARHRAGAELLVEHMAAQAVLRDGRLLVPDENRTSVLAEYATGLAGSLSLLLRLRYGGPRAWLPEGGPGHP
ncbi:MULTISPECIES: class IV lanthionine synthetase LanL [unclassified Streptomyces]|uniref:class IV lanthionine synthetase LanL n=1 Tax=unclassified Streptomyces TaxID=2593676 RepID=UPI000DC7E534|nr:MULTISPECIES: class IV lanthionine synthetase LanL [unclassified Streptomyces]AWZ06725.1 serine/threonine protein kinase [Streptomyces sp. ICC4]AWZ15815.1 serine/threonine protein kinase [Streptomyces sp. ICC1]